MEQIPIETGSGFAFAPRLFRRRDLFARWIKRLIAPFRPCMTWAGIFSRPCRSRLLNAVLCANLKVHSTREASLVDLALKLNVLAVCAVFVFVGAILLGAF
jgi:hypothetical protein